MQNTTMDEKDHEKEQIDVDYTSEPERGVYKDKWTQRLLKYGVEDRGALRRSCHLDASQLTGILVRHPAGTRGRANRYPILQNLLHLVFMERQHLDVRRPFRSYGIAVFTTASQLLGRDTGTPCVWSWAPRYLPDHLVLQSSLLCVPSVLVSTSCRTYAASVCLTQSRQLYMGPKTRNAPDDCLTILLRLLWSHRTLRVQSHWHDCLFYPQLHHRWTSTR